MTEEELRGEVARLTLENVELRSAIEKLQMGEDCWCDNAIGNPMMAEPIPTMRPVSTSSPGPKCGNENHSSQGSISDTPSAPIEPAMVLFGLIRSRSFLLPNTRPNVNAATSLISTANTRNSR